MIRNLLLSKKIGFFLIVLLGLLAGTRTVEAATITSAATGNWNAATTWAAVTRTGTITTSTVNKNLTGNGTAFLTELAIGSVVKTSGGTTIGTIASIASNTSATFVANAASNNNGVAYTAQVVPLSSDNATLAAGFTVTLTASASITNLNLNATTSKLIINSGQTLTVSGTFSNSGTTTNGVNGPGTILFTGTTTFGSLTPTGTRPNIQIGDGTSVNTVTIGAATLVANLTVSANATLNNTTSNFTVGISGSITDNGTWNTGTGLHTLSGTAQTINGIVDLRNVTVSGTYTNNGILTITTALGGNGGLTNAGAAELHLNFTGALGITTLDASAAGNIVDYGFTGTQTVKAGTYSNLTLSGTGTKTISSITINSGGSLTTNNLALIFSGDFINNGTFLNAGSSPITISGTAIQSIEGFTTTGAITFSKTGGTATLQGNVTAGSLAFTSANNTTLALNGNVMAITGTTSLPRPSSAPITLEVGSGSLTTGALTLSGSSSGRNTIVTVSTGTVTITGNFTAAGTGNPGGSQFIFSGNGTLNVGGNGTNAIPQTQNACNFTPGTGTVNFTGAGSQTIGPLTYNNLTISGSGTKTLAAATPTVAGTLTVKAGTTLALSTFALGATTAPTNVVLEIGSTGSAISGTGALYLGGDVTVNDITGAGGATISCPVYLDGDRTFTVADDGTSATDLTISSIASTAFGIIKDGAGTLVLSGTNTYSGGTTVNDGTLSGTNASALGAASGDLAIANGAKMSVGAGLTINVGKLTLGGDGTASGTWGSTSSSATYKNNTYFAATTGRLNVGTASWQTPTVTPTVETYTYNGSSQGPNSATNTGTGSSYTFSYVGVNGTTYGASATQPTNAGSYTVTATVAASADGFYNQASSTPTDFTIDQALLNVSATGVNKGYDGNTTATVTLSDNRISGDVLTLSYSSATFSDKNIGIGKAVSVSGISVTGTDAGNYTFNTTAATTANITAVPLTITASNLSKCFGQTLTFAGTEFLSSGLVGTDVISNVTLTSAGAASSATVASSPYSIVPSAAVGSGLGNYTISYNNGSLTVNPIPSAPTTTGGLICIGTANGTALSASGAVSGDKYRWYDSASGGTLLYTSTSNADNSYSPVVSSTTDYWISILSATGCESSRTKVTATYPSASPDNQSLAGTDSWIGHVYDGTNNGVNYNGNFSNYFGTYNISEAFDELYGGNTNCFTVTSSLGSRAIYTETYSVRYRLNSTKRGLYVANLGSDDGSRLAVDGNLIYNNWSDQAWTSRPRVLMNLTGSSSLVYDFYENGGGNQVTFQNLTQVLANNLTINTSQSLCMGSTGNAISGDVFPTSLTTSFPGISLSGTGYQWAYSSTSASGPWTDISGATAATYTPLTTGSPFNVAGTYYIIRKAVLSSANNVSPNPYVATNESNAATLIVYPVSVGGTVSGTTAVCSGTNSTTLTLSGQTGNVTKWQSSPVSDFSSSVTDIPNTTNSLTATNLTTTTYYRAVVQSGVCSPVNSSNGTITVNTAPSITGQPSSPAAVCSGTNSSTFTVAAIGPGLTYQWQRGISGTYTSITGGTTPNDGATYSGYTGTTLTVTNAPSGMNGYTYRCIVSGTCSPSATSNGAATLTVNPTSVGGTVTGGTTICSGSTSGLLTLSGQTGTVVKWQYSVSPFSTWTDISNTGTTYTSGALTQTTQFRAVVQSGICSSANSAFTMVTVNPTSVGGTVSGGTTICSGSTSGLLTLSGQTGTVSKWQYSVSPFSTWTDIPNTGTTYTSGVLTQTTQFRAVVTSGVCSSANSAFTTVTVNPTSVGGTVSGGTTICSGSTSGLLTLSGQTGTVSKWQYSVSPFSTWTDIPNTGTTYTSGVLTQTTQFRAVVTSGVCSSANSAAATVTVNLNLPVSVLIEASANPVCSGTAVTYTATPTNGGAAPVYQWKVNGADVGSNSSNFSYKPANGDIVSCNLTSNTTCSIGNPATSNTINMAVSLAPTMADAGPDQIDATTCGLTTISLGANIPATGTGFWSVVSGVGGSFSNTASPNSTFSGNAGSTYTLRWTISNPPCVDSYDETIVTFNTIPTITGTSPAARCDAGVVTLGATSSAGTINWYNDLTGGSPLATGATIVTPVISSSTTYYVDATSNGCTTGSRTAVLATVNDLPTITVSPDVAICKGSNTTLTAIGGTSYVWSPSTGLNSSGGASVIASPITTTSYTVTGTDSNGCSNTASITVTVNDLPQITISSAATCAPNLLTYSVSVIVSSGTLTSTQGTVVNNSGNEWTISLIPSGTSITLTVSDSNTCSNSLIVAAPNCSCPAISAPVSNGNKSYCEGSPVPTISASVATGETVDWYSASSIFLHSGINYTPTSAGTYYAEARNTTSNCKSSTRTAVTITENPNASISLTSEVGTDGQTVCINSSITNISYLLGGGATNAAVTGLPTGLSGNYNSGVFTISGIPAISGVINYTVSTTGSCLQTSMNGTVIVDPVSIGGTISGTSSQICLGANSGTMTLVGYNGNILNWERQLNSGGWTNLGNGNSSTYSEVPYAAGRWEYRVKVKNGVCTETYSSIFSIDVDPTTVGGWISSTSHDPICEGTSTPILTLNGITGNVLRWEKQLNSGSWQNIANTSTSFSEIPSSGGTWKYRALIQSGTCPPEYQTPFTVLVQPTLSIVLGSNPEVCEKATSATILYTSTTGSPAGWILNFDESAISNGFGSPQNGAIIGTSGNININIPYNKTVGIYHATLKVITYYPECSSIEYPVNVTVNPDPTVNAGGPVSPICQGNTSEALGGSWGGGATSAIWSDGGAGGSFSNNDGTSPAETTYTASFSAAGTVTLTLTTFGGACGTTSASKQITVNPLPETGTIIPD